MGLGHVKSFMEAEIVWPSASAKLVAIEMAYHADRKGLCRISQSELSESVGLSRVYVGKLIDSLCDAEILVRLGHGRYGVRYGTNERGGEPKGVEKEEERLRALLGDGQGIAYDDRGWPSIVSLKAP